MYFKTIDFSKYSSIKIGQPIEVLMLEEDDTIPTDRYLIGGANNLLVSPAPPPLMMLSKDFATITQEEKMLTIGAAMPTGRIISYAKLAMNAGVKEYEIFNILHSIKINGEWVLAQEIEHGYRFAKLGGIATHARFEIQHDFSQKLLDDLLNLRANQPHEPSAGSAFKNPEGDYAGRLIEAVGLKGTRKGQMQWSNVHANFLVNLGGGTFEEAKSLIDLAKSEVLNRFDIKLIEEIKIL